ncbi:C-C motif chemokine 27 [Discoglossus pictus]
MKLLLLGLLAITLATNVSQAMSSSSVACCTQLAKRIPQNMLPLVTRVQIQLKDGVCNLKAVILHTSRTTMCMDPKNKSLQKWIKKFCRNKGACETL